MTPIDIQTVLAEYEWLWNLSQKQEEKEQSNRKEQTICEQ